MAKKEQNTKMKGVLTLAKELREKMWNVPWIEISVSFDEFNEFYEHIIDFIETMEGNKDE